MKFLKYATVASLTTALILSTSVNAALIDNGAYTTDTITSLDWLDLTETTNRSYADISSELGIGGEFEGWRYASVDEARDMFMQFGFEIDQRTETPPTQQSVDAFNIMVSLFGDTLTDSRVSSVGITGTTVPGSNAYYVTGAALYDPNELTLYTQETAPYSLSSTNVGLDVGSYLVRTSVVPVPGSVWLFGSGLLGLVGFAKRKKT